MIYGEVDGRSVYRELRKGEKGEGREGGKEEKGELDVFLGWRGRQGPRTLMIRSRLSVYRSRGHR